MRNSVISFPEYEYFETSRQVPNCTELKKKRYIKQEMVPFESLSATSGFHLAGGICPHSTNIY